MAAIAVIENMRWQATLSGPRRRIMRPAKLILEIGVDAFGGGALLVADMLGGAQADGFAGLGLGLPRRLAKGRAGMALDDRDMAQGAAVGLDLRRVVGVVHQIVERREAGRRHGRQGDRHLAVVQAGRGQNGRDRDVAVGDIEVELVADLNGCGSPWRSV